MQELKKEFNGIGDVKGFTFTQLEKNNKAAFYEVLDTETNKKHYEVFLLKISKPTERTFGSQKIQYLESEIYPKTKAFGIWAWCFKDYQKAKNRFNSLTI